MDFFADFDHYDVPIGLDGTPYGYYEAFRDWAVESDRPIGWSEKHDGFWVVVGYDAGREIFQNPAAFSSAEPTFPGYATPYGRPLMLAAQDEPDHKKYRQLVQGPFSPKGAAAMTDVLRATTNDLIDKWIGEGRVDVVSGLANELPARAIAAILGVPPEHGDVYRTWTHAMAQGVHTDPEGAERHMQEMMAWFEPLLEDRRRNPGDDVLSGVIRAEVDGQKLSDDDVKDFFAILLLGGIDNTTKLLSNMLWRLAWDKELRRRLIDHPETLPMAIDEFLRYYSPAMTARVVKEPISLQGVDMEPGQHVLKVLPIMNRDSRQFPNPDTLIPDRNPNRHVALGLGIHRCLGAHLIKIEARVAAEEFLRRIPAFELDLSRNTEWLPGQVSGMQVVPIVFNAGDSERVEGQAVAVA